MSSYPTRRHQRLNGYDYRSAGFYFVTLCIQHRLPLLGRIVSGEMCLNSAGEMIQHICTEISRLHEDVSFDTLVAMPDHLHAVVYLAGDGHSLSDVVHDIKSHTTARYAVGVREMGWPPFPGKLWQPGFYDRIIRDEEELTAIRAYVVQNPLRWSLKQHGT